MKSIFKIASFFLFSIIFLVGCKSTKVVTKTSDQAADKPKDAVNLKNEAALLWKVEGNGIQTSYIFGTMHILKSQDFKIKETVKTAFKEVDQLVLEIDMDDPDMQITIMQHVVMKDEMTLDQLVDKDIYAQLDVKLKKLMGVGLEMFKTWQPIMLSSLLIGDIVGEQPASFEGSLMEMAQTQEIEVLGLETIEEQLGFFHDIPYKDQAGMIKEYINKVEDTTKGFEKMTTLYLSEDIDALYNLVTEESKRQNFSSVEIVDKRNENWIPKMKEMAMDKATFFGVGAGHLGGPNGVVTLLKKAGFTLTAVR